METEGGLDEGSSGIALEEIAPETVEELYHGAPCGYLTTHLDGTIARVNQTLLRWTGFAAPDLVGRRRLSDLLSAGGRIYHETHYAPLLRMQGRVEDVALDIVCSDGHPLPVVISSEVRAEAGRATVVRTTVLDATIRHGYERELVHARRRAEASEEQVRGVALALQRSLLQGGLEEGQGFTVEARYRPAVRSLEVGGDWYDSFLRPDGDTLAVSVGDVVGRGLTAACAMGQIRSALRALAETGAGPAQVLDHLDAFVARVPDARMATVAAAEIDLRQRTLRFACAGHLPPLVVAPEGAVELLWAGRSPPLAAFPLADARPQAEVALAEQSRILLYTDGLVERRGRDIDDGLALLCETVSRLRHAPPSEMVDEVMGALLADEGGPDDVCLLCVTLTARPGHPPATEATDGTAVGGGGARHRALDTLPEERT